MESGKDTGRRGERQTSGTSAPASAPRIDPPLRPEGPWGPDPRFDRPRFWHPPPRFHPWYDPWRGQPHPPRLRPDYFYDRGERRN